MKTSRHLLSLVAPLALLAASATAAPDSPGEITYSRHVAPLFQTKCQECHRPQGLAPFSLLTYEQTRAWAKSIRKEVNLGRMPPWGLDPNVGKWANDPTFSADELAMLNRWLDGGMPEGNPEDLPAPLVFHEDWNIGQPDVVYEMPEVVEIAATGVVDYQHFVSDMNVEEDLYVQAMEVLPGNRKVVHHIIVFLQTPDGKMFEGITNNMLDVYAPGSPPGINPPGVARLIPKGSKLLWQVHYTPTGEPETDRSKFGIIFSKEKPRELLRTATIVNTHFEIPPHAGNHRVEAEIEIPRDATIYSYTPHMHYRGKAMDFYLRYPDGREELACSIPKYDFDWQLDYKLETPLRVPAGTRVKVVAHFDNSANNPDNPDPTKTVRWGEQTWEEMMMGGIFLSWANDTVEGEAPAGDLGSQTGEAVSP